MKEEAVSYQETSEVDGPGPSSEVERPAHREPVHPES